MATNFIRQLLVVAHVEIRLLCVGCSCLQNAVKLFDDSFRQRFHDGTKKIVEGNKVIGCLDDVVHRHSLLILEPDGAGFKDVSCLLFGLLAAFNSVGVVGELHLGLMVESSLAMCLLFINEERSEFVHKVSFYCTSGILTSSSMPTFNARAISMRVSNGG